MTSGKGRGLIQKEKLCPVAARHDLSFAALPVKNAADPGLVPPPGGAKRPARAMKYAAIARQRAAR